MIRAYSDADVRSIRAAGAVTARILHALRDAIRPGLTTKALDALARKLLREAPDAKPAFLGYRGYPAVLCASVNDVVVHGIPSEHVVLREDDLVGIDFGAVVNGFFADAAVTIPVGAVSSSAQRLIAATEEALSRALRVVRPGAHIGDIGYAVQSFIEAKGYGVIRDLVGHGVGRALHEDPKIPNWGRAGEGEVIREGAVLAIEPMVAAGSWKVTVDPDGWTVRTQDHSLAAHFEHTVVVTRDGCRILTAEEYHGNGSRH